MISFLKKSLSRLKAGFARKEERTPSLESFREMEAQLRRQRAHPRPEFQRALLSTLRARHETLQEHRLASWVTAFRIPRWATASFVVVLLVGSTTLVGAAPAPVPHSKPFGNLEADQRPDFAPITITFDQPMMSRSVEKAFTIEPAVEGQFFWNGTREMVFVPLEPLEADVTYTVSIAPGAKSFYQKKMDQPYEYTFEARHIELSEEMADDLRAWEELRGPKDQPLRPHEKKFLNQKFSQLEQSVDFSALTDDVAAEANEGSEETREPLEEGKKPPYFLGPKPLLEDRPEVKLETEASEEIDVAPSEDSTESVTVEGDVGTSVDIIEVETFEEVELAPLMRGWYNGGR